MEILNKFSEGVRKERDLFEETYSVQILSGFGAAGPADGSGGTGGLHLFLL